MLNIAINWFPQCGSRICDIYCRVARKQLHCRNVHSNDNDIRYRNQRKCAAIKCAKSTQKFKLKSSSNHNRTFCDTLLLVFVIVIGWGLSFFVNHFLLFITTISQNLCMVDKFHVDCNSFDRCVRALLSDAGARLIHLNLIGFVATHKNTHKK